MVPLSLSNDGYGLYNDGELQASIALPGASSTLSHTATYWSRLWAALCLLFALSEIMMWGCTVSKRMFTTTPIHDVLAWACFRAGSSRQLRLVVQGDDAYQPRHRYQVLAALVALLAVALALALVKPDVLLSCRR